MVRRRGAMFELPNERLRANRYAVEERQPGHVQDALYGISLCIDFCTRATIGNVVWIRPWRKSKVKQAAELMAAHTDVSMYLLVSPPANHCCDAGESLV